MAPKEHPPSTITFPALSSKTLRVCCYGSSSPTTPTPYLNEAYNLGHLLATHGHTTVNGGGASGCMAYTTQGAVDGGGKIVGVRHEMFMVDDHYWAHPVFQEGKQEFIVATGDDLQQRKKLLVEGADAIVVLPGGPGTWDELWEMGCAKNIGLTSIPIVCINVDGFYDLFRMMLQRAHEDTLLQKSSPDAIVKFVENAEEAVNWVESEIGVLSKCGVEEMDSEDE